MEKWAKISLAVSGLISAGVGLAFWAGAASWNAETARMIKKLKQSASAGKTETVSFKSFDSLPAPVARYFQFALKEGQPVIRTVRIRHAGEFNLNDKWISFESEQHFRLVRPGLSGTRKCGGIR